MFNEWSKTRSFNSPQDITKPVLEGFQRHLYHFRKPNGKPFGFHPNKLTAIILDYIKQADIGKTGSCHLFWHSMFTLMLEKGADVRFIQELLGHARLDTTERYTHVSIVKLKDIHSATHPGTKLRAKGEAFSKEH